MKPRSPFPVLDPVAVEAAEAELDRVGGTGTPAAEVFARLLSECPSEDPMHEATSVTIHSDTVYVCGTHHLHSHPVCDDKGPEEVPDDYSRSPAPERFATAPETPAGGKLDKILDLLILLAERFLRK